MRKSIWLAAILGVSLMFMMRLSFAQQTSQSAQTRSSSGQQATSQSKPQTQKAPQPAGTKSDSLAEAARKAREAQKNAPKASTVFTNDNIPTESRGVSVVGVNPPPTKEGAESKNSETLAGDKDQKDKNDEAAWRQRFADARHKVDQDSAELAIMQRELGELQLQNYSDPSKALMQSVFRTDITKKQNDIAAKQKQLDADKKALSDLEDELRKAGGDPGWARE